MSVGLSSFQRPLLSQIAVAMLVLRYTDNTRFVDSATRTHCGQHIVHKNSVQQSMHS
jgi:hypothetical protein